MALYGAGKNAGASASAPAELTNGAGSAARVAQGERSKEIAFGWASRSARSRAPASIYNRLGSIAGLRPSRWRRREDFVEIV